MKGNSCEKPRLPLLLSTEPPQHRLQCETATMPTAASPCPKQLYILPEGTEEGEAGEACRHPPRLPPAPSVLEGMVQTEPASHSSSHSGRQRAAAAPAPGDTAIVACCSSAAPGTIFVVEKLTLFDKCQQLPKESPLHPCCVWGCGICIPSDRGGARLGLQQGAYPTCKLQRHSLWFDARRKCEDQFDTQVSSRRGRRARRRAQVGLLNGAEFRSAGDFTGK